MQLKCISHCDSLSGSVYRGRGITLVRIRVRTLRLEIRTTSLFIFRLHAIVLLNFIGNELFSRY